MYCTQIELSQHRYCSVYWPITKILLQLNLNVIQEVDLKNPKSNKKNAGFTQEERDGFSELLGAGFVDTYRLVVLPSIPAAWLYSAAGISILTRRTATPSGPT